MDLSQGLTGQNWQQYTIFGHLEFGNPNQLEQ